MSLEQHVIQIHVKPESAALLCEESCFSQLDKLLAARGLGQRQSCTAFPGTGYLLVYTDTASGRHATVHVQTKPPFPVLVINVVQPGDQSQLGYITTKVLEELREEVKVLLKCKPFTTKRLPVISHGTEYSCYFPTVDDRWSEYDFDKLVFEQDTPYQNVKIFHSQQYGNVLVLDDDINLAESDLPYTKAITGNGREDFTGKRVLILGGGDGGILRHLLEGKPKYVEMLEIDQVVIDQAIKHLRGCCGSAMDSLTGSNYNVRVEDCVPALHQHIKDGLKFDYIINDLTAIPISTSAKGDFWDFMRLILSLSMQVLAPNGKYFTQGNGIKAQSALKMYEGELAKLDDPVAFSKEVATVPSFQELWVFYEIWKKQ